MWKQLQNRRGVALTFVIMILLVTSIMVSIVALIANANIVQASAQEKGLQAYYIARSGAELAYEVLMTTTPSLIEDFKDGSISSIAADTVDFEKGSATVEVSSSGSGENQKIMITSVGTLAGGGISRTVKLEFYSRYDVYPDLVWSK